MTRGPSGHNFQIARCRLGRLVPLFDPRSAMICALVLLAALLGGCLGGEEDPALSDEKDQDESKEDEGDKGQDEQTSWVLRPSRFALGEAFDEELRVEGSFEPQETGIGGGFFTGDFQARVDLSDLVPAGVPVRLDVSVQIDAEEVPLVGPTGRVDPLSNGTVWYERDWRSPEAGQGELEGVVKRGEEGSVGLLLEAYVPGHAEPPDVHYVVEARARAVPDEVPDGVPVALMLEGNETVVFEAPGEGDSEVVVFSPDDEMVGRVRVLEEQEWTSPKGAAGEFVVMASHGSGSLRIVRQVEPGQDPEGLRALGFEQEQGDPVDVVPMETTSWSFEVDRVPLRVQVTLVGPDGDAWACYGTANVLLSSPQEQVLDRSVECPSPTNVPFLYEEAWTWTTRVGDERVVSGTYEASVEADLLEGFQVHHLVQWYER